MEKLVICSPQLGMSPDSNLGGEVHDREILKALADLGVEIHIILPLFKKHENHKNFHFYYLPSPFIYPPWIFNFLILPYLLFIYLKTNFNLLRVHSPEFSGLGAVIFKLIFPKVKIATTFHHVDCWTRTENFVAAKSDLITTVSQATKVELLKKLGDHKNYKNIVVVPNGVSGKYRPDKKSPGLVNQYDLTGKKTLLYLGQLIKRKNLAFLLHLIKKLPTSYKLLLCGGGSESKNLKILVRKLNLEGRVIFTGVITETQKVDYYNLADYFVYPSLKEGFGLSVVEAMACGKVVITSDIPPFLEIAANNENIFALPLNFDDWVKEILFVGSSPSRKQKMVNSAKRFAEKLTWHRVGQSYLEAIQLVLKASR